MMKHAHPALCALLVVAVVASASAQEPKIVIEKLEGFPPPGIRLGGPAAGVGTITISPRRTPPGAIAHRAPARLKAVLRSHVALPHPPHKPILGVVVAKLPAAVRAHLDVRDGVGLLVERVLPGSPAAKAGIRQYDVLTTLDAQLLINPEQLATLLRMLDPKRPRRLNIIRGGHRELITLAARGPARAGAPGADHRERARADVRALLEPMRKRIDEPQAKREPKRHHKLDTPPKVKKAPAKHKGHAKPPKGQGVKPAKKTTPKNAAPKHPARKSAKPFTKVRMVLKTRKYAVSVQGAPGKRTATVRDAKGKVLFKELPEANWGKLPEEVRRLLKAMKLNLHTPGGAGIQIRLSPRPRPARTK